MNRVIKKILEWNYRLIYLESWISLPISLSIGVVSYITFGLISGDLWTSPYVTLEGFHNFLFSLGAMIAIIGPLLFGFALQEMHAAQNEKTEFYAKFESAVSNLRIYFDELNRNHSLDEGYRDYLVDLSFVRSREIEGPLPLRWIPEHLVGIADWMNEQIKKSESSINKDDLRLGLLPILDDIEELARALDVNSLRRYIGVKMLHPSVRLSMFLIIGVIVLSATSSISYDSLLQGPYFVALITLLCLTIALALRLNFHAYMTARETAPDNNQGEEESDDEYGGAEVDGAIE